ncbi:MAG: hypothetical protein WCL29_03360 [Pseudomonadota bacterium]
MSDSNETDQLRDLSCKQAACLLSIRRDRPLDQIEEAKLSGHLLECMNCQRFDRQMDLLSMLAKRYAATGISSAIEKNAESDPKETP